MRTYSILVCRGPECGERRHSADVYEALRREAAACALAGNRVTIDRYSCFGRCQSGVNVLVREVLPGESPLLLRLMPTAGPRAFLYHRVAPAEARRILEEHVGRGQPIVAMGAPRAAPSAPPPPDEDPE